jgi:HPt (histidine-containing phosphotransfer) domain-containing protein
MSRFAPPAETVTESLAPFDGRPPTPASCRADALARFEGDVFFFERIVPLFRQAANEQAAALADAAERGDLDKVQHWAHTLKGSLLTVGAASTADLAQRIELAAGEGYGEGLTGRVRRLAAETAIIVANLSPELG